MMNKPNQTNSAPPTPDPIQVLEPFHQRLDREGLTLARDHCRTLQINTGLLCDLACRHCHLDAGPHRREIMSRQTMAAVMAFAERHPFEVIDITGGAPELVPHLPYLLQGLAGQTPQLMLRSNLTALETEAGAALLQLCLQLRVTLVASFPSTSAGQADSQRGQGVWNKSIAILRQLNQLGYGQPGSGLELNLVANPAGAFLPATQLQLEQKFKRDLQQRWGIVFNRLFTFANMPLGRFRRWLDSSGNLEPYLRKLAHSFNPCTLKGLMCRSLVSIGWDGTLYDCDFNLAAGLPLGRQPLGVGDLLQPPPKGALIATGDHCYACMAGSGFT